MNYETPRSGTQFEAISGEAGFAASDDRAEPRTSRKWLYITLAVLVLLGCLAAFLMLRGEDAGVAGDDGESQAPSITVISPGRTTVEGTITATGTIAARRALPVGVAGEGGRVVSVAVDAGDWVRAGQTLVSIDRSVQAQQLASASAQIEVARSDARLAQANLDRALKLVDRGFISTADVDRLTATRDAARAGVQVAQAQAGELRERSARLNVVAPAAGYVLSRNVEPGQIVSSGSGALFTIARGGEMELMAQVSESDLARLSTGVEAIVQPAGTSEEFTGQIWQLSPTIDQQTRQGVARIALSYAPQLRPGGFATARIRSGTVVAPVLPESAVLSDDEGSYVFIVDDKGKARRRSVEAGMVTDAGVTIASGLKGSERIVLRAGGFLTEGETVNAQRARN